MARIYRKLLATIAEWTEGSGRSATTKRELLGLYTPDSSIEFNSDIQTVTDVLGITHGDVEKTEPVQTFDPHYLMDDSDLDEYMVENAMKNNFNAFNGQFTVYVVAMWMDSGTSSSHAYSTAKHSNCSIFPTSLGGEAYTGMPLEVHFSNDITEGTVNTIDVTSGASPAFAFSAST